MEWNSKSTTEWEWENTAMYGGNAIEMDRVLVENGPTYSSPNLETGSSSKSSISTYMYPSTKDGTKDLDEIDIGLEKTGEFPFAGGSSIGLKLGVDNKSESFSVIPASSSTKRVRGSYNQSTTQMARCQVEGCNLDLTSAKDYHRRHRICESHSKCPMVIVAGLERRFCQQCSRFHDLSEFDEKKRSCRRRLSDHNARRRRQHPEAFQFCSTRFSSLYDQSPQVNFLLHGVPIRVPNQIWESGSGYRRGGRVSGESLVGGHLNGREFDRTLNFPNNSMPNAIPLPPRILNHGIETSVNTSASTTNYNGGEPKELYRALSLLSTDSQSVNNSQQFTSLHPHHHHQQQQQQQQQLVPQFNSHPLMNSDLPPNWPQSSQDLHNNVSSDTQFQEFQMFYPNHIN